MEMKNIKFLFRAESAYPEHWKNRKAIVNAYFENCAKLYIDPWIEKHEPITKSYWDMIIDRMERWGEL